MSRQYTLQRAPRSTSIHIDYAAELNEQQLAAVTAPPGPLLVIAGAGSGKTRTLTYRVAYLLENGIDPRNILLLTFTNKAARQMLDRVANLLPVDASGLWGGTFHSVGNRILRRHGSALGYSSGFTIMDREDQKDWINTVVANAGIDPKEIRFPKGDVLAEIFSFVVNTEKPIEELLAEKFPYFLPLLDQIVDVHARYEKKKKATNSMDFDDLLQKTLSMFQQHERIAEFYRRQFQFILVDEYQDTNKIQADLVDLLARDHRNVMVVGDDAQSIYSWRGANFQSILELRDENVDLSDIAVLYRAHYHAIELQLELSRRGIPYQITSGIRFFEQAHIKDVVSFIRFVANPRDEVAFNRMVKLLPGIGNRTAENLWQTWTAGIAVADIDGPGTEKTPSPGGVTGPTYNFGERLLAMNVPSKSKKMWTQLAHTLDEIAPGGEPNPPSEMITSVVEAIYDDYAKVNFANYQLRREDLDQLAAFARQFKDVHEFLSQLALISNVDAEAAPAQNADKEAVNLSSVHQAKGLEVHTGFVILLSDGMFPSSRSLDTRDALEEERRLFYVAITRSRDELYLTFPHMRLSGGYGDVFQRPSRFLKEIPAKLVEDWQVRRGK